jgi:hypothetical protein
MAGDYPDMAKELGLTETEADALYAMANKHKGEPAAAGAASPGVALTFLQDQEIELASGEAFTRYLLEDARPYLSAQQHAAISHAANHHFAGTRRNLKLAQRREASRAKH